MQVMSAEAFSKRRLKVDVIVSVATYDVVPSRVRVGMAQAAFRNLRVGGAYVVIIPRNDTSILRRCSNRNRYLDGHVFAHHGTNTFFRNFSDKKPAVRMLNRLGFRLHRDLSIYRQVALILQK